jgi:hypothetical protein
VGFPTVDLDLLVSRLIRVVHAEGGSHVWIDSLAQKDAFRAIE